MRGIGMRLERDAVPDLEGHLGTEVIPKILAHAGKMANGFDPELPEAFRQHNPGGILHIDERNPCRIFSAAGDCSGTGQSLINQLRGGRHVISIVACTHNNGKELDGQG